MLPLSRSLWLPGLLLSGLLLTGHVHARAAEPPLPLDEYWQKLDQTWVLAARLQDAPPEDSGPALRAAADEWAGVTALSLPDGAIIPIGHSWLVASLRAEPPNPARVMELINTHRFALATWPQRPIRHADFEALNRILARPEFQWQPEQPSLLEQWLQRIREWIWELIQRLLARTDALETDSPIVYVLTGLTVAVLAVVLVFVARGLLRNLITEAQAPAEAQSGDENLTAEAALLRAQSLSGEGDYRAAVRYLYLSTLLLLEERGLLRYNRSLTNREYLRSVAHLPGLAARLRQVVEVFDRVWYGFQPLDQAAYAEYAANVAELHKQK